MSSTKFGGQDRSYKLPPLACIVEHRNYVEKSLQSQIMNFHLNFYLFRSKKKEVSSGLRNFFFEEDQRKAEKRRRKEKRVTEGKREWQLWLFLFTVEVNVQYNEIRGLKRNWNTVIISIQYVTYLKISTESIKDWLQFRKFSKITR